MMNAREDIIAQCLRQWQPDEGDLIAYVNSILVDENQHQLFCSERRDLWKEYEEIYHTGNVAGVHCDSGTEGQRTAPAS